VRIIVVISMILLPFFAEAQSVYGKKARDPFPKAMQYEMKGWYVEPGLTYMVPQYNFQKLIDKDADQTDYDPKGKPGIFLAVGKYQILKYKW